MENYIREYPNAMSDEACNEIIRKFEEIKEVSYMNGDVAIGSEQYGGAVFRKDFGLFFEQLSPDDAREIQKIVGENFERYKEEFIGLERCGALVSHACKVQKTPPKGGFHNWHHEHGPSFTSYRRVAVWLLYLTTHEDSGETEFIQQGLKVKPKKGTLLIWPAGYTHPHRGNPVYDKDKYIATGWFEFYDQPYQI